MGSFFSAPTPPDDSFLNDHCHKIYIVTSPDMSVFKLGYTGRTLRKGVWNAYRRAYGKSLIIHRVYKASVYKEDEIIHTELERYRSGGQGREIYPKKYLDKVVNYLDKRYNHGGVGPFTQEEVFSRYSPQEKITGTQNNQRIKQRTDKKKGKSREKPKTRKISDSWVIIEEDENVDLSEMMNYLTLTDLSGKTTSSKRKKRNVS